MFKASRGFLLGMMIGLVVVGALQADSAAELRVATFQSDATPPIGHWLYAHPLATVEHPLLAKGVVLEQDGARYVLCAIDWCVLSGGAHTLLRRKMGDVFVVHLPGEPMLEFQLFAQKIRPDAFVAVAGYGDGCPSYICTDQAFKEGAYEPGAGAVGPGSEKILKEAIRELVGLE